MPRHQQTACMASSGPASSGSGAGEAATAPTDLAAWDAARLAADAQAMAAMAAKSESESSMEEAAPQAAPPGAWKWAIRKQIWDLMEEQDLADFPRPGAAIPAALKRLLCWLCLCAVKSRAAGKMRMVRVGKQACPWLTA